MARGKYLSFDEARRLGKLRQFAREHEIPLSEQHPQARERLEWLLDAVCKDKPPKSLSGGARTKLENDYDQK